jgi:alpha/beta hydrolase fold
MSHTTITSVPVSFDDAGHGEPALVYLPGWCSTRISYAAMVEHTARHRRFIAIDWRGHGISPAPDGDFGWPQMADDVLAVLAACGVDRFVPVANARRRKNSPPWTKAWGFLQDVTTGYGYRPALAGLWFITLLVIGTVVFSTHPPAPIKSSEALAFNPFFYTLDLLLPVVTYGQQAAFAPRGLYQWVAYGLMTAGWILATTIIAGITRALSRS